MKKLNKKKKKSTFWLRYHHVMSRSLREVGISQAKPQHKAKDHTPKEKDRDYEQHLIIRKLLLLAASSVSYSNFYLYLYYVHEYLFVDRKLLILVVPSNRPLLVLLHI